MRLALRMIVLHCAAVHGVWNLLAGRILFFVRFSTAVTSSDTPKWDKRAFPMVPAGSLQIAVFTITDGQAGRVWGSGKGQQG